MAVLLAPDRYTQYNAATRTYSSDEYGVITVNNAKDEAALRALGCVNIPGDTTKATAERILRSARRAVPTGVMASPLTPTEGTLNANSTVVTSATTSFNSTTGVSGATVQVTDARVECVGGVYVISGSSGYTGSSITRNPTLGRSGINGSGFRFGTDSQTFDVCLVGGTNTGAESKYSVRVTDLQTGLREWTSSTDYLANNDGAHYYKFDLGSAKPRIIEIYLGRRIFVRGFNVAATAALWAEPQPDAIKTLVFGDSYVDGGGAPATRNRSSFAFSLGDGLGVDNVIPSGLSSSGYSGGSANNTWVQRIANGDAGQTFWGELDLICLFGSINDSAVADATLTATMTASLTDLAAQQPRAIIAHAGPQRPGATQTPQARYDLMRTAFLAVAAGNPRFIWVDNSPSGENWMSGTGNTGATTGTGTNDIYVGTDNTHWNDAGHAYGGRRFAASLVGALSDI